MPVGEQTGPVGADEPVGQVDAIARGYDPSGRFMTGARAHQPHGATSAEPTSGSAGGPWEKARVPVSACLIVRDEERRLPDCLASIAFCDEIVVVDSGSHDRTLEIARAAGAKVLERPWTGYAAQRNFALDHASHDWVLEIDADERVSDPLRGEIETFVRSGRDDLDIAAIPLRHIFLGRRLGPSALYPMYRHRFFRRARHRHDERRMVHEGLVADGPTHAFVGDLEHRLADGFGEALSDCLGYARLQASSLTPPIGVRAYLTGILARPAAKLLWRVVAFAGWRDGWQGLVHIGLGAASDSLVWARLARSRLRHRSAPAPEQDDAGDGHFGRRTHRGPARIVAIADDAKAVRRAIGWLASARAEGADVALIASEASCAEAEDAGAEAALHTEAEYAGAAGALHTEAEQAGAEAALHIRLVPRLASLQIVRALEAEQQLRPVDALVGFGRSAERLLSRHSRLLRLSPRALSETATPKEAIECALADHSQNAPS